MLLKVDVSGFGSSLNGGVGVGFQLVGLSIENNGLDSSVFGFSVFPKVNGSDLVALKANGFVAPKFPNDVVTGAVPNDAVVTGVEPKDAVVTAGVAPNVIPEVPNEAVVVAGLPNEVVDAAGAPNDTVVTGGVPKAAVVIAEVPNTGVDVVVTTPKVIGVLPKATGFATSEETVIVGKDVVLLTLVGDPNDATDVFPPPKLIVEVVDVLLVTEDIG